MSQNSNNLLFELQVPTGTGRNLSDVVLSSPICFGDGAADGGGAGAGGAGVPAQPEHHSSRHQGRQHSADPRRQRETG